MTFEEYFDSKYKPTENASLTFAVKAIAKDAWDAAQADAAEYWTKIDGTSCFDILRNK